MTQLQQLNSLLLEMAGLRNEAELLKAGLRGLVGLLGIDHAAVLLHEPDGASARVVSEFPNHGAVGQRLDMHNNPMRAQLLDSPEKIGLVQDVDTDPVLTPTLRDILRGLGINAMLVLPLMVHGQLIGTVGLDVYQKNRPFTAEMIALAQAVATQLSVSVQNIRLLLQSEERVGQLQHLTTVGQALHASLQLDAILNAMLIETPRLFPVDHMIIALYDPTSEQLKDVAQYEAKRITIDLTHAPLVPIGTTLIGDVWQSGRPLHIEDTAQAGVRQRLHDARIRAVMVAPIAVRERRLGVTYIGSLRPHAYSQADAALLGQVNGQLAAALENSAALAESQRAARAQMLVNTITAHIQQSSDLEDMLAAAALELGRALGARRARVVLTSKDE
jgi:GAF domain-containing protein